MLGHPHLQKIGVFDFGLMIVMGICSAPVVRALPTSQSLAQSIACVTTEEITAKFMVNVRGNVNWLCWLSKEMFGKHLLGWHPSGIVIFFLEPSRLEVERGMFVAVNVGWHPLHD